MPGCILPVRELVLFPLAQRAPKKGLEHGKNSTLIRERNWDVQKSRNVGGKKKKKGKLLRDTWGKTLRFPSRNLGGDERSMPSDSLLESIHDFMHGKGKTAEMLIDWEGSKAKGWQLDWVCATRGNKRSPFCLVWLYKHQHCHYPIVTAIKAPPSALSMRSSVIFSSNFIQHHTDPSVLLRGSGLLLAASGVWDLMRIFQLCWVQSPLESVRSKSLHSLFLKESGPELLTRDKCLWMMFLEII